MAKKKVESEQPEVAAAVDGSKNLMQEAESRKRRPASIVTTEGNMIDKIRIFQKDGATMVQVDYGKQDRMKTLFSHALTPEQSQEFQRLDAEDHWNAKEYAVRTAYPMHADDEAFHRKDVEINGRKVDYIVVEKLTADKLTDANKHLEGSWQMSFGEKGNKDSRFYGIMNREELANFRHRAEVVFDSDGKKVVRIGNPLSMADIAGRMEQRITAQREAAAAKREAAGKVDWSKFSLPEGIAVTGLHYVQKAEYPDRVLLAGKVNGIQVSGLLSKNETTAVKNKMATLAQIAGANKEFRQKVMDIVGNNKSVGEAAAVKALVARAADATTKSFTPEQRDTLLKFAEKADTPEAREQLFAGLWEKAEAELKESGVSEAWQKDAREELDDLAQGVVREEAHGIKR